ncbi:tetratricopeptide repeat protein, partial [bacterium]|nr:tetratricopeptide repeat protein [bacterium]
MFHRYFFYCLCVLLLTVPIEASNFNPFELEINLSKDFEVERVDSYPGQPGNPVPPGPPVGGGFPTYPPYNPSPSYPGYESASQLYQRGLNAYSQSDFRNAISYFTQFLDRFPYDLKAGEACFYCADSYKQLNDFYNAITLFRRVVNQYPSFKKVDEAAFFIGFCLVKVNDFYGALGEFRSFVVKFSLSHLVDNAWYVSGRTHEQIQDIQNAIFCYRKVVYEFPNSEVYRASRDRLNALEGNHPPTYPPTNPPYPPTYPPINVSDRELYDRGHSELVRGNYPKAISYFSELIERYPQSDLAD